MTRQLLLLDSIAVITSEAAGTVVVSGSHGGVSAAHFVLAQAAKPYAVFFNDAGVGKNDAGVAALALLEQVGVIAATYSHQSACIGDAHDAMENGCISRLNRLAQLHDLRIATQVSTAAQQLRNDRPGPESAQHKR